jgi:hypothetical protein
MAKQWRLLELITVHDEKWRNAESRKGMCELLVHAHRKIGRGKQEGHPANPGAACLRVYPLERRHAPDIDRTRDMVDRSPHSWVSKS